MKAVHFGAGNIGRGFIGALLNQSGCEVCFIDVVQELVDEINRRREYVVETAAEHRETFIVRGVRAVSGLDPEAVSREIIDADLVTTAVGPAVLERIAPVLAKALTERLRTHDRPLNIIACENAVGASTMLKSYIFQHLDEEIHAKAKKCIGFPDSAVDRIVPLQSNEDRLKVIVEPFYEWVVDRSGIRGEIPEIKGITWVSDLTPYIERKLYTVNTGHATAAYLGYLFGFRTMDEALRNPFVRETTQKALEETGRLLVLKHAIDPEDHRRYTEKIMSRFANPHLSDEVTRIGRSPIRKLGPGDRLMGPAVQLLEHGMVPEHLSVGIAAALLFDHEEDEEAMRIRTLRAEKGLYKTIRQVTGVQPDSPLFARIIENVEKLESMKKR
ncbi:mannitol-1-phosphate 5-dehydrogenase [Staphylospora marina]|uniref:mannitol-1-phosphate 5-dehydrogenase n=1 Tax=Staphylospora marina TaxID=2490858 RepID=UPI000F5C1715|nr:mannitol-1-phosphate 5-dehydrogenase [Staphylospora marina]